MFLGYRTRSKSDSKNLNGFELRDDAKKTGLMSIIRDYWVKNRYFFINNLAQ